MLPEETTSLTYFYKQAIFSRILIVTLSLELLESVTMKQLYIISSAPQANTQEPSTYGTKWISHLLDLLLNNLAETFSVTTLHPPRLTPYGKNLNLCVGYVYHLYQQNFPTPVIGNHGVTLI